LNCVSLMTVAASPPRISRRSLSPSSVRSFMTRELDWDSAWCNGSCLVLAAESALKAN
jgi:hypothetical protein